MRGTLYTEALQAAEGVLTQVYRLPIQKALNPDNPRDYLVIQNRLANAVKGVAREHEAAALRTALDLLDVDWKKLAPGQREKVVLAARAAVLMPPPVLPKVAATLEATGKQVINGVRKNLRAQFGPSIGASYSNVDERIIHHAALSSALYIRDAAGQRADALAVQARQIVAAGLKDGLGRDELGREMRDALNAQGIGRPDAYWTMAAGVFVNRSRVFGNLAGFEEAGITHFRFDAILDEVTSVQCRFLHGREFEVATARRQYEAVAASVDPEAVKELMPWVRVKRDAAGVPTLYARDTPIAAVRDNAVGRLDETGTFDNAASSADLAKLGVTVPPLHGNCRSTIRPVLKRGKPAPVLAPAAPFALTPGGPPRPMLAPPRAHVPVTAAQAALTFGPGGIKPSPIALYAEQQALLFGAGPGIAPKPIVVQSAPELLADSLQKLLALSPDLKLNGGASLAAPANAAGEPIPPPFDKPAHQQVSGAAKKAAVPLALSKLIIPLPNVPAAQIIAALKKTDAKAPVVVKHDGLYYLLNSADAAHVVGQQLLAVPTINVKVIDLDAIAAKPPKKVKPKPADPPAAVAAAAAVVVEAPAPPKLAVAPPDVLTPEDVMTARVAGPSGGSNGGACYAGKDGVARFVKQYKEPGQAYGEYFANSVYKELGLGAPDAVLVKFPDGRVGYASNLVAGKNLGSVGLTPDRARAFMKGFVADILLANWDSAGLSLDNAFVTPDGSLVRIDNGGSLLYRAMGGEKNERDRLSITEWEGFFSPKNESYSYIAKTAGYDDAEDPRFRAEVMRQLKDVVALRERVGGWDTYVEKMMPGFPPYKQAPVVAMLNKRADLLEKKLRAFEKEAKTPKPKPKPDEGYFAPLLGGAPSKPGVGITLEDLDDVEGAVLPDYEEGTYTVRTPNKLPGGEALSAYRKRVHKKLALVEKDDLTGIVRFTGGGSSAVRDFEAAEQRGYISQDAEGGRRNAEKIARAVRVAEPEPGTVFRGMSNVTEDVVKKILANTSVYGLNMNGLGGTSSATWDVNVAVKSFAGGLGTPSTKPPEFRQYRVIFQIRAKTAVAVETVSEYGASDPITRNEAERILPKDSRFRTLSARYWKGHRGVVIVELEEVDPSELPPKDA